MTDMLPGLGHLKDGRKHQYLRLHRDEILAYAEARGEHAARERWNIKRQSAWDSLLHPANRQPKAFTKADRAIARAEIAEVSAREAVRKVKELEDKFSQFVPLVADVIGKGYIEPALSRMIKLPSEFEVKPEPDALSLDNFQCKSLKQDDNTLGICYVKSK